MVLEHSRYLEKNIIKVKNYFFSVSQALRENIKYFYSNCWFCKTVTQSCKPSSFSYISN